MKKQRSGYLLVEVAAAFGVLCLGLALFATALSTAGGALQRRQGQRERLNADLERYYTSAPDAGEPCTLTLTGEDFSAEIAVRRHTWQGEELTLYEFTPEGTAP